MNISVCRCICNFRCELYIKRTFKQNATHIINGYCEIGFPDAKGWVSLKLEEFDAVVAAGQCISETLLYRCC